MRRVWLFLLSFAGALLARHRPVRGEPSTAELHKIQQLTATASGSLLDEPGRVPRVYVIGAQKGGSSSLYEVLVRHPALCGAIYKEPNFFLTNIHQNRDFKWYLSLFIESKCLKKSRKLFVDGSCMLHGLDSALRAMNATYSPEQMASLKFIALLREPVARDYSWYKHRVRALLLKGSPFSAVRTFGECFQSPAGKNVTSASAGAGLNASFDPARVHMCHTRGEYLWQLRTLSQYLRRDQLLVVNSQQLFSNDKTLMPTIAAFLGLKMSNAWLTQFPKVDHIGTKAPLCLQRSVPLLDCAARDGLVRYYAPKNAELLAWLNETRSTGQAPHMEPPFETFEGADSLPCVDNAREEYDKRIVQGATGRAGCVPPP